MKTMICKYPIAYKKKQVVLMPAVHNCIAAELDGRQMFIYAEVQAEVKPDDMVAVTILLYGYDDPITVGDRFRYYIGTLSTPTGVKLFAYEQTSQDIKL